MVDAQFTKLTAMRKELGDRSACHKPAIVEINLEHGGAESRDGCDRVVRDEGAIVKLQLQYALVLFRVIALSSHILSSGSDNSLRLPPEIHL